MRRFAQRRLLSVATVLVAVALSSCANYSYEVPKTGPRITMFTLEPAQFYKGDAVNMTLDFCEAKDGLGGNVEMDYEGSLSNQRRNPSFWKTSFYGAETCGTFRNKIYPQPTDPAPFSITYFVRFKSGSTHSNWAKASVVYLGERDQRSERTQMRRVTASAFALALAERSCWAGTWVSGSYGGKLEICFKLSGDSVQALVQNSSGAPYSFDGPVTNLVLHEAVRRVTFVVSSGAPYDLRLVADDRLEGTARGGVATIKLRAQEKKT